MTPRRSLRADAQRRLRAAAPFIPPPPQFTLPPAPTKLQQTSPALTDRVRSLYEAGAMPVAEIARLAGVNERTLYRYVERGGWRRRYPVRGAEAAAANRGRKREPRPPQPKGAGGRFIPRDEWGRAQPSGLKALDLQGASRAVAACEVVGAMANEAFSRAVALHDAETQARIFALVMRALRDLAAMVDEPEDAEVKPRRRRGYVWKPGLVSPVR
jgi:hypothetical protein